MGFFDMISETIRATGEDVGKRTRKMTDQTKLKMELSGRESETRRIYQDLGKKYYSAHKNDEEPEYEEIAILKKKKEEMKELKGQVLKLRKEKLCPKCGHLEKESAAFCSACGTKMA